MSRYPELAAKVDAFFARVMDRYRDQMACHSGCSECCHVRLTVTGIEAAAIRAHVPTLPPAVRAQLGAGPTDRCAALGTDGKCQIYEARPLVCRSHGVPMKAPVYKDRRSLGVYSTCHYNFAAPSATNAIDADCVFDQETMSTLVIAVNKAAGFDDTRQDLAELLHALAND